MKLLLFVVLVFSLPPPACAVDCECQKTVAPRQSLSGKQITCLIP